MPLEASRGIAACCKDFKASFPHKCFISIKPLQGAQILKSEHSRRSLLPILRHLKKIKEIRGPGKFFKFHSASFVSLLAVTPLETLR